MTYGMVNFQILAIRYLFVLVSMAVHYTLYGTPKHRPRSFEANQEEDVFVTRTDRGGYISVFANGVNQMVVLAK